MMNTQWAVCFAALLAARGAAAACALESLVEPARGQVLGERQPTLRWSGDPSATYRVQLAVVLPEARVLASYDLQVRGTRFTLPAPIPMERAGVKVLVSRDCPAQDTQDLQAQGAWFFVDLRGRCALEAASLAWRDGRIAWQAAPRAQAYRVRFFRQPATPGDAAAPLQELTSSSPFLAVPDNIRREADLASVQPVCDGLPGRAEALRLKP
jgi:hypothetical protein